MKITEEQVRYVAGLANLQLTPEEVGRMAHDMDEILTHIDKLSELDIKDVPPMAQVLFDADETATLRADETRASLSNESALSSAPLSGQGFFKVPKVIER